MAPRQPQPPRPAPRGVLKDTTKTTLLQHGKLTGMIPQVGIEMLEEPVPPDMRLPDDAYQRPAKAAMAEGAVRKDVTTVNFSAIEKPSHAANSTHCEIDRREMGDIGRYRRRTPPPCPCPEDELVQQFELNRRRAADFRKITLYGMGADDLDRLYGPPLDDRDQRGYCRMMAKLMGLDVSAGYKTPTHQRLRNRIVTEQTWYDLQAKMFLPPPVTNDRPITVVLGSIENKRLRSAGKERAMWRQDMTASVGRGAGPAFSVFWGHAPRARLCACPDTPCRCTRTRAMPRVFNMPRGRALKHLPRPPSDQPYVVDRLKRNVELDRRFYIRVAERGLMDCIRPEVCLDECVPYFKVDTRKEAIAYDERCLDLTRRLRDTCLDDECDVCDEMIEEEESSSSSSDDEDLMDTGIDEALLGPCRAKCSATGSPGAGAAVATPGDTSEVVQVTHTISGYMSAPSASLDDECCGCVEFIKDEESSSSSSSEEEDGVEEGPCRAECATLRLLAFAPAQEKPTVLARMRTYFMGQPKPPQPRRNLLGGPKQTTGVNAASLDSMGSLRSVGSARAESSSSEVSDSDEALLAQRSPWPAPPVTAMYTLMPTELPPPATTELPPPTPTELLLPAPTELLLPAPTELPPPAPTELPPPAPTELPPPAPTELTLPAATELPPPAPTEPPSPTPAQRSPWPAPPVTAMYTLTPTELPPPPPPRVQFAAALPIIAPVVAQVEKQDSYPSQPARAHQPPNQLLIRDECPEKTDLYRWYKRWFILWIFDIRDTHRTRGIQVTERDIATAYDPNLIYESFVGDIMDAKRIKKMQKKIKTQKKQKNKSTSPMVDKDRKQAEKEAIEQKKREAREMRIKEKLKERKRMERARQRARKKKLRPKVFCECKAREFKIIEARKTTVEPWDTWCPPDPAPEQEIVYEQLVLSPEDLPPQPPPIPPETRDLLVQIDLPPIEPGTVLSDEMYSMEELEMMGSVEILKKSEPNIDRKRTRLHSDLFVASSREEHSQPKIPTTPRPPPRSQYDTKPTPKPRFRGIVMQTDSDPGPLREQNIQYERQCVCKPGPNSKCTCKSHQGESGACSCKPASPLDGGPPCICKPRFGPGYRTKRRKKCRSRKCKKCREKGLSGRDYMAKTRTKEEKIKEEKEKIRIEKAKLKAMKQAQKREGRRDHGDLKREKVEMKIAAQRLKEQMREKEEKLKEQKRREIAKEKRLKLQMKEQRRQQARDEDFRRRLSEMRRPEAEFCGCKDWQKGLCRVKIPPDIEAAREALLKEAQQMNEDAEKLPTNSTKNKPLTPAMAVMLARSVDNSDSEFILPTHRQTERQETFQRYHYKVDNFITNATISRDLRDSIFEIANHLSFSESDIRDARCLNESPVRESRSWYDDIRITYSSSFHKKSYSPQRLLTKNFSPKSSRENSIRKDFNPNCTSVSHKKGNWQQNTLNANSAYPCRRSQTSPDRHTKELGAADITSIATSPKVNKCIKPAKIQMQSTRRQVPEYNTGPTVDNDITKPKRSNKAVRSRHRPVCTNMAETVFARSDDVTKSIVDMNLSILTQQNDSSSSKAGLHRFVEKVFSKIIKNRSEEALTHEIQHNCNIVKGIERTIPKAKLEKNRDNSADKFPQESIKMMNSRFTKRKFGKNIVTSLISIFNSSSCRMPKGVSSVMPPQMAESSIAEEPCSASPKSCGRSLFAKDSGATSVAERPGRHLLDSQSPTRRTPRLRDQTR